MFVVGTAAVAAEQAVLKQTLLRKMPAAKDLCKDQQACATCTVAYGECTTAVVVQT